MTNLFPQIEYALTLKELIYGKGASNLVVKIIAASIFTVLYADAYLQIRGAILLTYVAFLFLIYRL